MSNIYSNFAKNIQHLMAPKYDNHIPLWYYAFTISNMRWCMVFLFQ